MRRALAAFVVGALAGGAAQASRPAPAHDTDTARNRIVIERFVDVFYRQKKVRAAFERFVSLDYKQHNPMFPDGRDGPIDGVQKLFGPEARLDVKRIIVEGDLAVVHILARLKKADRGLAVVDIYRLEGGKIVEHWDVVQPIPEKSANPHPMF